MGTRGYLIGQGYNNLKKHGGKTFSTMLIICATMFILGIFIIAYINIQTNINVVTESQGLQAFISDDIDEADIQKLAGQIKQIANVKEITYLNKEDAFKDAKDTLKDYAYLLDGLESINPFPRSFIVVFSSLESTAKVKEAVESVDGIYKVAYNEAIINAVISISKVGNVVLLILGVAMIAISIFIISNTIKLSVYSNKREIYIMKYIGATPKFIKSPFIASGMFMGISSALISWVVVSLIYIGIYANVPKLGATIGQFGLVSYKSMWYIILIAFVFIGILLGALGSSIAIKKYLKDFKPSKSLLKEEKQKTKLEQKKQRDEEKRQKIVDNNSKKQMEKEQEKQNYLARKQELDNAKSRKEGRRNVKK